MHKPVLLHEAIQALNLKPDKWYIDATFGRGGHTKAILETGAKVIAFDHDDDAIQYGRKTFEKELKSKQLILIRENFSHLIRSVKALQEDYHIDCVSGILFDFGTSSDQLMDQNRGFSFDSDAELDMRMDQRLGVKASDLLAVLSEQQLTDTFKKYGGERDSRSIAKAIIASRNSGKPVTSTKQLADLITKQKRSHRGKLHPATKVFQSLRIIVNNELSSIEEALPRALNIICSGSHIVTISFHEGEDRLVKTAFKQWEKQDKGKSITKKPITPTEEEINNNPKSRSAKMRIFEKS